MHTTTVSESQDAVSGISMNEAVLFIHLLIYTCLTNIFLIKETIIYKFSKYSKILKHQKEKGLHVVFKLF